MNSSSASVVISSTLLVAVNLSTSSSIDDNGSSACFEHAGSLDVAATDLLLLSPQLLSLSLQLRSTFVFTEGLHLAFLGLPFLLASFLRNAVDIHRCGPWPSTLSWMLTNQGTHQHTRTFLKSFSSRMYTSTQRHDHVAILRLNLR